MVLNCKNSPTQGPGEAEPAARVTRSGIRAAGEHEAVTVAEAAARLAAMTGAALQARRSMAGGAREMSK